MAQRVCLQLEVEWIKACHPDRENLPPMCQLGRITIKNPRYLKIKKFDMVTPMISCHYIDVTVNIFTNFSSGSGEVVAALQTNYPPKNKHKLTKIIFVCRLVLRPLV